MYLYTATLSQNTRYHWAVRGLLALSSSYVYFTQNPVYTIRISIACTCTRENCSATSYFECSIRFIEKKRSIPINFKFTHLFPTLQLHFKLSMNPYTSYTVRRLWRSRKRQLLVLDLCEKVFQRLFLSAGHPCLKRVELAHSYTGN